MGKSVLVVTLLCLSVLMVTGCQQLSPCQLAVVNESTQLIHGVYLSTESILPSGSPIKPGETRVFDCLPKDYDISIKADRDSWIFESVSLERGQKVTLVVGDSVPGSEPPQPEVEPTSNWTPSNLFSAVIHWIDLHLDWSQVVI